MFLSCTKEAGENLECETLNIYYVDINNADNEPYYWWVDGVYMGEFSDDYYMDDYPVSAGTHEFFFQEVNAIIPNEETYTTTGIACDHTSIIFGANDPLK